MFVSLLRISYCTADKMHDKVFAYIVQSQQNETLQCHAFLCTKRKVVCEYMFVCWALCVLLVSALYKQGNLGPFHHWLIAHPSKGTAGTLNLT